MTAGEGYPPYEMTVAGDNKKTVGLRSAGNGAEDGSRGPRGMAFVLLTYKYDGF